MQPDFFNFIHRTCTCTLFTFSISHLALFSQSEGFLWFAEFWVKSSEGRRLEVARSTPTRTSASDASSTNKQTVAITKATRLEASTRGGRPVTSAEWVWVGARATRRIAAARASWRRRAAAWDACAGRSRFFLRTAPHQKMAARKQTAGCRDPRPLTSTSCRCVHAVTSLKYTTCWRRDVFTWLHYVWRHGLCSVGRCDRKVSVATGAWTSFSVWDGVLFSLRWNVATWSFPAVFTNAMIVQTAANCFSLP